jgi:hypothetical protein
MYCGVFLVLRSTPGPALTHLPPLTLSLAQNRYSVDSVAPVTPKALLRNTSGTGDGGSLYAGDGVVATGETQVIQHTIAVTL